MGTFAIALLVVLASFVALMIGLNVFVRIRAQRMQGKPLPPLPGDVGTSIAKARTGLVYFFTPSCAACRLLTPRLRELSKKNRDVFVIDASENLDLARAFRIMATPSTVEVESGRIVQVHIGVLPPDLLQRFAS
ncbi:MAG TPA: thioredoxin family protein [Polyangiaceae bacterium]|nr:thioredoxin family protein [Polyangiaceae bacterium]